MARKATASAPQLEHPALTRFWPHQIDTFNYCLTHDVVNDTSDAGTGKTAPHLVAYSCRPKPRGRLLVLCPKTLMYSAWGADCEEFTPELTMSFATAEQRLEAFRLRTDVVVMNHDGVKWLADKANLPLLAEFDHVIVDEYSAFKNDSQRTKALIKIRKYFKRREGLNGTPNPKSVMELFYPMLFLDGGKRMGTSYYKLRNAVQVPTQIGPSADHLRWDDKPGANQAIVELLSDCTIRHEFAEVMKHVPPNHTDTKVFRLSPRALALYQQMERDYIIALENDVVSAVHAASLRTKLLQIASGAVYDGGNGGSYKVVDTQRYELIGDLVEEREHSVVFFNWKHQRDLLGAEFKKRGFEFAVIDGSVPQRSRDQIVKDYQAGRYKTILLHPRTGAHGLTLTRGTRTLFSSPIYEADLLKQGARRIHRGSQDKPTETILVQAQGTVEDLVYARLFDRAEKMDDLLTLMKLRGK